MLSEWDYTRYAQLYMDMVFRVAFGYVKSSSDADDVDAVAQATWNEYQITKFQSRKTLTDGHTVDCSYYLMYQPELGYLITLSSIEDNLDVLEQIAKGLEIEQTDEIVSAADYHEHNEFLDCGIG